MIIVYVVKLAVIKNLLGLQAFAFLSCSNPFLQRMTGQGEHGKTEFRAALAGSHHSKVSYQVDRLAIPALRGRERGER